MTRRKKNEYRRGPFAHWQSISSRARGGLLLVGILAPVVLLWGCSGVVSGQNAKIAPPPTTQTYNLSGMISPAPGGGGATVTLSGAAIATTTTNSAGNYTFTGLASGTYAVTPSHTGYTFSPTSQVATVNGANVTGLNFTATAQVGAIFSISGTISPTAGGSGATVTLSGAASGTTTPNSAGSYTFGGLANGTFTVTPSNVGYAFSPASQSVTVNGANFTGVNFTATAQQAHSVALAWNASTSAVSSYNVYRSEVSGTGYTRISSTFATVLIYMDTTVLNGTTYYYVTTAVDTSGFESVYSNQVSAVIP
jgi:carboxypeptidase family protein